MRMSWNDVTPRSRSVVRRDRAAIGQRAEDAMQNPQEGFGKSGVGRRLGHGLLPPR